MMDEIGRLHPNNVKGILRFANERNILLINGSPTSQNATDYSISAKISNYTLQKNTLTTSLLHSEDGEELYAMYNLTNGNHLLDYTYAKLDVQFSQSEEKRYIGFVARAGIDTTSTPKNMFGQFSYASQDQGIQTLLITLKDEENRRFIATNTPDMTLIAKDENTMLLNGDKTLYFSNLENSPEASDIRFDVEMTTFLTEDYESIPFTIAIIDDQINMDSTQYFEQIFDIKLVTN